MSFFKKRNQIIRFARKESLGVSGVSSNVVVRLAHI